MSLSPRITPEQIFLYLTNQCNLKCIICYLGEQLNKEFPLMPSFQEWIKVMELYAPHGVRKITFLGGEPTLYPSLPELCKEAKIMGYKFVRITTNGIFNKSFLLNSHIREYVDIIAFSLDGDYPALNDVIRGEGTFQTIKENIQTAVSLGYDVRINTVVTSHNIHRISNLIVLSNNLKVNEVNLNLLYLKGYAAAHRELKVDPSKWLQLYDEIKSRASNFNLKIKIPKGFMGKGANISSHICIAKTGKKTYVLPSMVVYYCPVHIGTVDFKIGRIEKGNLIRNTQTSISKLPDSYCGSLKEYSEPLFNPLCIHAKEKLNSDE